MKSPLILISGSTEKRGQELNDFSLSLALNYPLAIEAGGGLPWLLPCLPSTDFLSDSVRRADGVLLTGGDDVHPKLYQNKPLAATLTKTVHTADPQRDLFELMLLDEVF